MENTHLIEVFLTFGALGRVGIALAEKLVPLFPSYVMLVLVGMFASDLTSLSMSLSMTSLGSLIGSACWYGIGRALGSSRSEVMVGRFGRFFFFRTETYERLVSAYRQDQFMITLIGQVIPVIRIYLPLSAGVLRLRVGTFVIATTIGIIIWNTLFLVLGYVLRGSLLNPAEIAFVVSSVVVGIEGSFFLCAVLLSK